MSFSSFGGFTFRSRIFCSIGAAGFRFGTFGGCFGVLRIKLVVVGRRALIIPIQGPGQGKIHTPDLLLQRQPFFIGVVDGRTITFIRGICDLAASNPSRLRPCRKRQRNRQPHKHQTAQSKQVFHPYSPS